MLQELDTELGRHGLTLRGGLAVSEGDGAPSGIRTVLLVGHYGASHWLHFLAWRAAQPRLLADPLDHWSKTVIGAIAARAGLAAAYPSDPPFLPFQRWAMRAEGLRQSPLGLLIHPVHGLWHAYRGALLSPDRIDVTEPEVSAYPCDTCIERPCLSACPVDAYTGQGFAYDQCRSYASSAAGTACRTVGCGARNACPVGAQ